MIFARILPRKSMKEEAQITIRLPITLLERYLRISKSNNRSLNRQIVLDLTFATERYNQQKDHKSKSKADFIEDINLHASRKSLEKYVVQYVLAKNKWNISETASELEISRPTLYSMIDKYQIKNKWKARNK